MKKTLFLQKGLLLLTGILLLGTAGITGCAGKDAGQKDGKNAETREKDEEKPLWGAEILDSYENGTPISLWESEKDVPYYDETITGQAISTVTPYITDKENQGGCVIICPGGGYQKVGIEAEGEEPAAALNEQGISAFVLNYRVAPYNYEAMLADVMRAVRYVRYHAETFGIDPDKIAIMGFSAGGHLSAMALEHYEEDTQNLDRIDEVSARPDCGVLCYAVLSFEDEYAHKDSRERFLGTENLTNTELLNKYSAEKGVTKDTPPCFVWHCQPDKAVPYENSELFAEAMNQAGVECELHIYPEGAHGIVLATAYKEKGLEVGSWFDSCVTWLRGKGF